MNKFLKWMLAIVGIVAVLFVIAAIVLPMLIDPNNYKDDIRAAVLEKTGRELTIGGEIEWTVFPSIGFDLYDLELSNREGFGDQPMLNIGAAGTSLKLIPLFSRKIEIGTIRLRDVSAYLHQKANGQNNWEDFSGPASGSQDESPGDDGDFGEIVVSGVEISNANVTWNDAGQITELTNFGLNASNIALGRPVDLEGGFSVNLAQSQMSGDVEFSGIVHSEANAAAYGIEGLKISFEGKQGPAGESIPLDLQINANADIDFNEDKATLSDFGLTFHDLAVNGELNVTSLVETPRFEGQLKVTEFSPKSLLKSLGMSAPDTADASALTSLQADMNFAGTSSLANMRNLNLKFDKSTFNGNFKIENFDRPRLAFDFRIDSLNLDDYLPAPGTETGTKSGAESAETDLTVEDFRGFTGGGDFRIEELIVAGLTITDVSLKMNSNGKGINFSPISSKAYGGLHKGDINIDASGNRPILTTSQQMNGIQVEGLLQDLAGSARLQGSGDIKLNIRTDLTNSQTSRQALSGDMAISFVDGAIVGINVAETIRSAKAALGKQSDSDTQKERDPKTDFSELSMTGVIKQGIFSSDDLKMLSPLLRVSGKGTVNLVEETIDYRVEPTIVGSLEGQGSQDLGELSGVPIPVRLTGNMNDPDIKVDILAAIAGSQKELINQKKDELLGELLGTGDDSAAGSEEGEAGEKDDAVNSLLDGVFGSNKDKKKKNKKNKKNKDDAGGN